MSNTILSLNFSSPTTPNFFLLPLFFNYETGSQVRLLLSATKPDLSRLLAGLNEIFNQPTISAENFYQALDNLVHPQKRFRGTVTLTASLIEPNQSLLVFSWGGSAILRRGSKAGALAVSQGTESVARAGRLKTGDTLILFNSHSPILTQPLIENLEQASDWTNFSLFSQAFLSQTDFENLGFYLMQQTGLPEENLDSPTTASRLRTSGEAQSSSSSVSTTADDSEDEAEKLGFFDFIKSKMSFLKNRQADVDDEEPTSTESVPTEPVQAESPMFPEPAVSRQPVSVTATTTTYRARFHRPTQEELNSANFTQPPANDDLDQSPTSFLDESDSETSALDSADFPTSPYANSFDNQDLDPDSTEDFNLDKIDDIYRRRRND